MCRGWGKHKSESIVILGQILHSLSFLWSASKDLCLLSIRSCVSCTTCSFSSPISWAATNAACKRNAALPRRRSSVFGPMHTARWASASRKHSVCKINHLQSGLSFGATKQGIIKFYFWVSQVHEFKLNSSND